MIAGKFVDPADNYEALAQAVAEHFGRPVDLGIIRATFSDLCGETLDDIECNPHEFAARVNDYAYGINYTEN